MTSSIKVFWDVINRHSHIAVISHNRPDGDAIGSTIGLGLFLEKNGKTVYLYNQDPVPTQFKFLEGTNRIEFVPDELPEDVSLLIVLDCADPMLLGWEGDRLTRHAKGVLVIDHHGTNLRYGDTNIVNTQAPSCTAVLAELFDGHTLNNQIATALYTGLSTDTGSFQYSSVGPETMRLAAGLMTYGINVGKVNRYLYQEIPVNTICLQQDVLGHTNFDCSGLIAYYTLTKKRANALNLDPTDTRSKVRYLQVIQGVIVSVTFEEFQDNLIQVSLRSKEESVNVAEIAKKFGGGGHKLASGVRMHTTLAKARKDILYEVGCALTKAGFYKDIQNIYKV